jgi:hypothetical protein
VLSNLADLVYTHRRAILYAAVLGAAIAGVSGSAVTKHPSPYQRPPAE